MRKRNNFSSRTIIIVLLVNVIMIVGIYLFFGWFFNSGIFVSSRVMTDGFSYREMGLCILLAVILDGMIDYIWIIRPLWDMEDSIRKYQKEFEAEEMDRRVESHKTETIDEFLNRLMQNQMLFHERERIDKKQRQKAEMYALQSQIDPHFLYNALDSIRGYALLHDMDEISDITEALSRVFRNMISDKHEHLSLRQERDNINNYMKIQQFRFNNKFEYSFEVDGELLDKYMVPRMVLQPLVENAIMHGLERKVEGGWVRITAYVTERRFVVQVVDNGVGMSEERLELLNRTMKMNPVHQNISQDKNHSGIALININKRLKLKYGNQFGIILSSTPNIRTVTEVVLPLLLNRK